jgi:hypothetical protein
MPSGIAVGQAIFGDQPDGALLDTAGVLAVGQSQVRETTGEAPATAAAAMAGEGDHHLDGTGIAEVVESSRGHRVAPGTMVTARPASGWPVAAAPFDTRLGKVFDARDALADIRDILAWTNHDCSPDARGGQSLSYAHWKNRSLH